MTTSGIAPALRRLYFARFGFAILWALAMFTTATELGPLAVTLLVLYPLVDVAAAVVDARSSRAAGLYVNIAISLLAAVGVGLAAASGIPAVLRVWGAWAILSGLIQLFVGVTRRRLGGQWPMIISGAVSALVGSTFILQAGQDGAALSGVAGYAIGGGILFLISAVRLGSARRQPANGPEPVKA
ncbi:hypothetical protein [Paractinoplanes durhamensis]|uniref:Membrane protein n=1 Tax=Paractinoplanes durhamensis TaxID=113563 RepID=A0ABQ3YWC1_9ACTN|nr:hypothetical protein [Actinoplanes durhamensis]GIE01892.1 membrane protein [Actinoplanes durhamensis]